MSKPCKECMEQARLLGISGSRELSLITAIQSICKSWASLKIAQRDDDAYNLKSSKAWEFLDQMIVEAERKCR